MSNANMITYCKEKNALIAKKKPHSPEYGFI